MCIFSFCYIPQQKLKKKKKSSSTVLEFSTESSVSYLSSRAELGSKGLLFSPQIFSNDKHITNLGVVQKNICLSSIHSRSFSELPSFPLKYRPLILSSECRMTYIYLLLPVFAISHINVDFQYVCN